MYSELCCFLPNQLTLLPVFHNNQSHSPRPRRRATTTTTVCLRQEQKIPWASSEQQHKTPQQQSITTLSVLRDRETANKQAVVVATHSTGASSVPNNLHVRVSQALRDYHEQANASTQRGKCTYTLGRQATDALYDARALVRRVMAMTTDHHIGNHDDDYDDDDDENDDDDDGDYHDDNKDQVVFAYDSVHAMHTLATSVCRSLSPKTDMIVLSALCATPVVRVWNAVAAAYGVSAMMTTGAAQDGNGQLDIAEFAQCLTSDTGQQRMRVVVLPLFTTSSGTSTTATEMDADENVYNDDGNDDDLDNETSLHSVVPFLKSVGALTIVDATSPTPRRPSSSASPISSSLSPNALLENSIDDDGDIDKDISPKHESAIRTTVPTPLPPRRVIMQVKRTRRVCNPDIVVTDVSVSQDGRNRPAFMIAANAVWKALPPAVDGERSLVDHSLDASDDVFDKRWESKWAPVPSRFECETATAPVAVAVAAALEYVVASHDDDVDV